MPAPANISDYCGLLVRSKLLPQAEVEKLKSQWQISGKSADGDLDQFRRFVLQNSPLSEYQAALIQRGHSEGFFLGEYEVRDRIGKGQSAGVYKARHRSSGQTVALKVLPGSKARQSHMLHRFQREGRLLTQLNHPNVVRAFQVGNTGSVHFIVMEHLEGETLDDYLNRRTTLPSEEAVRLIHQALDGLHHLHEQRMIHRDLKPANLMLVWPSRTTNGPNTRSTLDATLKILDIGIGRELFDDDSPETRDMALTTEGAILGTPEYLAPEQAKDARNVDIRADIYSLGCVLYRLLAGTPPFPGGNVMSQMVRHATDPLPRLPAGTPTGLQEVLDKMTAKKVGERYGTPIEAAKALDQFMPNRAEDAKPTRLEPAFEEWLDSESGSMSLPDNLPPLPPPMPSVSPAGKLAKGKSGTGINPVKPSVGAKPPPPRLPQGPPQLGGPQDAATRPAPIVPSASDDDDPSMESINVELVDLPPLPQTAPNPNDRQAPATVGPAVTAQPDQRSLLDLDRRDFIMIAAGAFGVLVAILLGVGMATLFQPKSLLNRQKEAETRPAGDGEKLTPPPANGQDAEPSEADPANGDEMAKDEQ